MAFEMPYLIYVSGGNAIDHPELSMTAASGSYRYIPYETELCRMPENATLHKISAKPLAFDRDKGFIVVDGVALGLELPQGYLRLAFPAVEEGIALELGTLAAVGWSPSEDSLVTSGLLVEVQKGRELRILMNDTIDVKNYDIISYIVKDDSPILPIIWLNTKIYNAKTYSAKTFNVDFKNFIPSEERINELKSAGFDSFSLTIDDFSKLPECKALFNKDIYSVLRIGVVPGFTDRVGETEKLLSFLLESRVDLLLLYNRSVNTLLIDEVSKMPSEEVHGVKNMLKLLKKTSKKNGQTLRLGCFNRKKTDFDLDTKIRDL